MIILIWFYFSCGLLGSMTRVGITLADLAQGALPVEDADIYQDGDGDQVIVLFDIYISFIFYPCKIYSFASCILWIDLCHETCLGSSDWLCKTQNFCLLYPLRNSLQFEAYTSHSIKVSSVTDCLMLHKVQYMAVAELHGKHILVPSGVKLHFLKINVWSQYCTNQKQLSDVHNNFLKFLLSDIYIDITMCEYSHT